MATINNSNHSRPSSNHHTQAARRSKTRPPPVAERAAASAPLVSPVPAATPTGATAVPAPAAASAPSAASTSVQAPAPAPAASPAASSVSAPPQVTLPGVPPDFVPVNPADLHGYRPLASEIAAVPGAVQELQGFSDYTTLFGSTAPDPGELIELLNVAMQWTVLLSQTLAWTAYVRSQYGTAWKDALVRLDLLKGPFQFATAANAQLLISYNALGRLLGAQKIVAKRAASSRARNEKSAATGTATAPATPTGATPGATAATTGATATPAAPTARPVPVTG